MPIDRLRIRRRLPSRRPRSGIARRAADPPTIFQNNPSQAGAQVVAAPPLGIMLTRHILRDGETILLTLKPSIWYIPFSCLRFCAVILIIMIAAQIFSDSLPHHARVYIELCILTLAARIMWAVLQWMSRLYILTNFRVLSLAGIFSSDIVDCPLRKIARVRIIRTLRDRPLRIGSIEIIPFDVTLPISVWQTIPRPQEVYQQIVQTMNRAKQGPGCL